MLFRRFKRGRLRPLFQIAGGGLDATITHSLPSVPVFLGRIRRRLRRPPLWTRAQCPALHLAEITCPVLEGLVDLLGCTLNQPLGVELQFVLCWFGHMGYGVVLRFARLFQPELVGPAAGAPDAGFGDVARATGLSGLEATQLVLFGALPRTRQHDYILRLAIRPPELVPGACTPGAAELEPFFPHWALPMGPIWGQNLRFSSVYFGFGPDFGPKGREAK